MSIITAPAPARTTLGRVTRALPVVWLGLLVVLAVLGPVIAPYGVDEQDLANTFGGPSSSHALGTDELGRDLASRLILATRTTLVAGLLGTGVAIALGVLPGLVAGYREGAIGAVVMRSTDVLMAFPPLILALGIVSVLGPSLRNAMLAVGLIFAPRFVRLTRARTLEVRAETYVDAARSLDYPSRRILGVHVFPNVVSAIIVQATFTLGLSILAEASLSFLGLGVQPPDTSWGAMLGRAFRFIDRAPALVILPGLMIVLTVLSFNALGDRYAARHGGRKA